MHQLLMVAILGVAITACQARKAPRPDEPDGA
jgi:hypothetical protein